MLYFSFHSDQFHNESINQREKTIWYPFLSSAGKRSCKFSHLKIFLLLLTEMTSILLQFYWISQVPINEFNKLNYLFVRKGAWSAVHVWTHGKGEQTGIQDVKSVAFLCNIQMIKK